MFFLFCLHCLKKKQTPGDLSGWGVCVCFFAGENLVQTLDSRSVDKFLGAIENLPFEFGCPVFQHGSYGVMEFVGSWA